MSIPDREVWVGIRAFAAVLFPFVVPPALAAQTAPAAPTLYEQARAAERRGQHDSAYSLAQRAAEAEPGRAEVQYLLGGIACDRAQRASMLGRIGPARTCKAAFSRAVALQPDNPDYLESLAQFLSQAPGIVGGDGDSALRLATRLQGIDDVRGTMLTATVLGRGDAREKVRADSLVEALARRHTGDRALQFRLANYFAQGNRPDRALAIDEQLLAADASDVVARFGVARNLVVLERDPHRAIELFRTVIAAPRPAEGQATYVVGAPWWRMGQAWVQLGQVDSARSAYQQALRVNPQLAQAQRSLDSLSRR